MDKWSKQLDLEAYQEIKAYDDIEDDGEDNDNPDTDDE